MFWLEVVNLISRKKINDCRGTLSRVLNVAKLE